ncbi:MAG: alpha/beta fold hydrolase [Candidatus Limnocylindria bacterium]
MPYELPPDPSTARRNRITRWVSFAFAALLVALVAYLGYVGYEGSRQLADPPSPSMDCRTPASLGWAYEAIGYDIESDAALQAQPNPLECDRQGEPADDTVMVGDVHLAGWYIPAGSGAGPGSPTLILAHGWRANKSTLLDRAAVLHDTYNILMFDFRNHGQSSDAPTTQGVRERNDLRAMVDWLEREKGPDRIGILGVSMGGASALAEATSDSRVDTLIIESTHASLAHAAQARLDTSGYPLALPGSWAILLGTLVRTGVDVSVVDPEQTIRRLDERPVLLIEGGADVSIGPNDPEIMRAAAEDAGAPVELVTCPDAGHAEANKTCAEDYAGWVLGFLGRTLAPSS